MQNTESPFVFCQLHFQALAPDGEKEMPTKNSSQVQWSISLNRSQLRELAESAIPRKVDHADPPVPKDFHPTSRPFIRGTHPAVLSHKADFEQTIRHLMRHELKFGMKGQVFGERLCTGLNRLNERIGLPPLTSCNLINGYSRNEFGLYTRANYSTKTGGLGFHYELDPKTFPGTVAHELTHLEHDYLFVRLLADFLGIGSIASPEQISDLSKLIFLNQGIEHDSRKLALFLEHRNGRSLEGAQRLRATQILLDFRYAPYLILIAKERSKAKALVPSRNLIEWLSFDYEAFFSQLQERRDSFPETLLPMLVQATSYLAQASAHHQRMAGKSFFRLLRYYSNSTEELSQYLLQLYRTSLYFEREAYTVGNEFA